MNDHKDRKQVIRSKIPTIVLLPHHSKTMLQDTGRSLALQLSRLNQTACKGKFYTVSVILLSLENVFGFSLNTVCLKQ